MAINLEESVVIIDEAHNILRIFEDSSSASFTAKEIALALSELDFLLDFRSKAEQDTTGVYESTLDEMPNFDSSQVYALKDCLTKFETGMVEFSSRVSSTNTDYTGEQVLNIFKECGVSVDNAPLLTGAIGKSKFQVNISPLESNPLKKLTPTAAPYNGR